MNTSNINESEISLSGALKKIAMPFLKIWWLFVILSIIGGAIGFLYSKTQKTTYRSHLIFALDEGGSDGMSGAIGLAAQFGLKLGGGTEDVFSGQNILEIMKSRRIIESSLLSVENFDDKQYTFIEYYLHKMNTSGHESTIHFPITQSAKDLSYSQDSVLLNTYNEFLKNYIVVALPDIKYNIFELNITSSNEVFTKKFTDRFIDETNKYYTTIKTQKTKETLDILEQRVAEIKGKLGTSIVNKAVVQDANLNTQLAAAQVPLQKEQTNVQAYGGAYAELFKNMELARFQYLKSIPLMQIIDGANYPMEKVKTGVLKTIIGFAFIFDLISFFILLLFFKLKNKF